MKDKIIEVCPMSGKYPREHNFKKDVCSRCGKKKFCEARK